MPGFCRKYYRTTAQIGENIACGKHTGNKTKNKQPAVKSSHQLFTAGAFPLGTSSLTFFDRQIGIPSGKARIGRRISI